MTSPSVEQLEYLHFKYSFDGTANIRAITDARPAGVELVLTGRQAPAEILARAHLVTRMEKLKHPYDAGVPARRGIEY